MHNENFTYTEEKGLQFAVGMLYPTPEPGSPSPLDILLISVFNNQQYFTLNNCTAEDMQHLKDGTGKFFAVDPTKKRFLQTGS